MTEDSLGRFAFIAGTLARFSLDARNPIRAPRQVGPI